MLNNSLPLLSSNHFIFCCILELIVDRYWTLPLLSLKGLVHGARLFTLNLNLGVLDHSTVLCPYRN